MADDDKPVLRVREAEAFTLWMIALKDRTARLKIAERILRLQFGNRGDHRSVGGGVWEMRLVYGPGYRVYFIEIEKAFIVLLCGGDKSSQRKDIALAKRLASEAKRPEGKYGFENE